MPGAAFLICIKDSVFIDPPYNTGNDFIYHDDFSIDSEEYDEQVGAFDIDTGIRRFKNTDSNGRFHSDWCSMIYSRLLISRNLLTTDGIIFISIDDHEIDSMLKIGNEIFGAENYIALFPRVTKKAGKTTDAIAKNHDYVLAYSKSSAPTFYLPNHTDEGFKFSDEFESVRGKYKLNQTLDYDSLQYSASLDYPITIGDEVFYPGVSYEKYLERKAGHHARADWAWRWSKELFNFGWKNGFVVIKRYDDYSRIYTKTYQNCKIVKNGSDFKIEYIDRTRAISSLEFVENEYSNDNSKKNLLQLFETSVFDYSKPVSLLESLIDYTTKKDDIVMDFFSGSATTAHASMRCSAESGNRKFVMVQIPDKCDELSEGYKAGYRTICDIGKERIRRAGKKIKEDSPLTTQNLDIGFRVLKLADSNMNDVYYSAGEYGQQMLDDMESKIRPDRTDLDLLFGCLLEWGLPLSLPYKSETIDGCTVHTYAPGDPDLDIRDALIACFDEKVPTNVIETIARRNPLRAVFREECFTSSPDKINVFETFKRLAQGTAVKVI